MPTRTHRLTASCSWYALQLIANPDVVEEFFYLVARYVMACPEPLVETTLLESVVPVGLLGLQLQHREAHRGILHCLETVRGSKICSVHAHLLHDSCK